MALDTDSILSGRYKYMVLEGNSRLAALHVPKSGTLPPSTIHCKVLDFSSFDDAKRESLIFSLLGQLHIKGKKDWGAYEDAGFFYRRHKNHRISLQELADETGVQVSKIRQLVRAYDLMIRHKDDTLSNFSYYRVYESVPGLSKHRDNFANLDEVIVSCIRGGAFGEATEMRRYLPMILENKPARKVFFDESATDRFRDAVSIVQQGGKDDATYKWLKAFRQKLALQDTKRRIEQLLKGKTAKPTQYELKKITRILGQLWTEQ